MSLIKRRFVAFKNNLTKIKNKEPLGTLSLVVIILLDIFVLSVVFRGLSDHTNQLISPLQYAPQTCREVFIQQSWTSENELDELQEVVLAKYYHYGLSETTDLKKMHPKCAEFYMHIEAMEADSLLWQLFIERQNLQQESNQLNISTFSRKAVTDNTLLTEISRGNDFNEYPSISAKNRAETEKQEMLTSRLDKINSEIYAEQKVKDILRMISSWNGEQRQQFMAELNTFEKWYKFRELGWQMLFLLPLFFIFYFWNHRSIKKGNGLQILISTHLLVIIAIPIFTKIIEIVLELIPKHFFEKLFKILFSLHLIAIWHYVLILLAVLVAIFLIYIIQQKLFNKKRLQQRRLSNSCCIECGKKLPAKVKVCPFCGEKQLEDCSECKLETYICGDYCVNCGVRRESIH